MYRKILVATDGSSLSKKAVQSAIELAGAVGAELVALYGLNRHANLRLLQRLALADLDKSAYHPEAEKNITVGELVERMGTHGASHLEQIERLKKAGAGRSTPDERPRSH